MKGKGEGLGREGKGKGCKCQMSKSQGQMPAKCLPPYPFPFVFCPAFLHQSLPMSMPMPCLTLPSFPALLLHRILYYPACISEGCIVRSGDRGEEEKRMRREAGGGRFSSFQAVWEGRDAGMAQTKAQCKQEAWEQSVCSKHKCLQCPCLQYQAQMSEWNAWIRSTFLSFLFSTQNAW